MKVKRQKNYSGYGDLSLSGASYMPAQVMTNYALDPIENSVSYLESTPVGKYEPIGKKLRMARGIVSPLKKILKKKEIKN
jgi:hypothetical protein